jgi:parallel beta-helix repeat protein
VFELLDKKAKLSIKSVFLIAIILLSSAGVIFGILWSVGLKYYSHGEIVIQRNSDFTSKYHFPGSGTLDDPYLISNLTITTAKRWGIAIIGTSKYFVIRNCTVIALNSAILISEVASGTCKIENNYCEIIGDEKNYRDDFFDNMGIYISDVNNATIINNRIVTTYYSQYCIILWQSINSKIINNICLSGRNGISAIWSENTFYYGNIIVGIFRIGLESRYNTDDIIKNNILINNEIGIQLKSSYGYIDISENLLLENSKGMLLRYNNDELSLISIQNNTLHSNYLGIHILHSNYGLIKYNSLINNTLFGVMVEGSSHQNKIYLNNFISNNINGSAEDFAQAYDSTNTYHWQNWWYDVLSLQGNYWSDLIWNEGVIYEIDGGTNTDPYPLENPVEI